MQVYTEEAAVNGPAGLEALPRILTSTAFAKSPRLCSLLEYIVVHSADGRHAELTEQQIGIQVFGRIPGYNSSDDTIVRGTARHLRQRLDQYYATDGADDRIRIKIPRGGYVAVFHEIGESHPTPVMPVASETPVAPPGQAQTAGRNRSMLALMGLSFVLAIGVAALAVTNMNLRNRVQTNLPTVRGPQPLWHALFTPDRKTLIIPGDASLDAFVAWEQRDVSLEAYTTQLYHRQATVSAPPTHMDVPLSTRSVTPMADLVLVNTLMRAADHMGNTQAANLVELRYARDVVVADTHDNNLVLIGSETFNPWVTLYQPQMDFAAHFDFKRDIYRVTNRAPKAGEQAIYEYDRKSATPQKALTHIALLNNGQGQGRVLIVEGTSMGTTYGAVNFLTHDSLWAPVLQQAKDHNGQLRDFEVLLSGDFFHGGVGNTHVLALHVH